MARSTTILNFASSTTDATSYATASFTVTANAHLYLCIATQVSAGTANPPTTITGHGLTWTQLVTRSRNLGTMSVYYAVAGVSDSTDTITFDFGAQTQVRAAWNIRQDTSNSWSTLDDNDLLLQGDQATATSLGVSLSGWTNAADITLGFIFKYSSGAFTDPGSWTSHQSGSGEALRLEGAIYLGQPSGTQTWTWTTTAECIYAFFSLRDVANDPTGGTVVGDLISPLSISSLIVTTR